MTLNPGMVNPMFGANPFAMGNPFMGGRMPQKDEESFNVDDLVKRIDAKIAELEEEERKEKEEEERKQAMARGHVSPASIPQNVASTPKVAEVPNEKQVVTPPEKPQSDVVNKAELSNVSQYADDTDDDNFFDDFFSDE